MLPTTTHPDSLPFLLVRPAAPEERLAEDEAEQEEVPSQRSVPPRAPPARTPHDDSDLPSVIVDVAALEAEEARLRDREAEREEAERASEVDGLIAEAELIAQRAETTKMARSPSTSRARGLAIATLFAILAAGGTLAGLRAHGVSARALGAALHLSR